MTIRDARLAKGLSLREVSVPLGIKPSRLSHIEAGLAAPTTNERERLTAYYGEVEFTSEEEITATRQAVEGETALIEQVSKAVDADANGRRSVSGAVACPKCGGTIQYSVAFNGHRRVFCVNGCVGWIE